MELKICIKTDRVIELAISGLFKFITKSKEAVEVANKNFIFTAGESDDLIQFMPQTKESSFSLSDVSIGKNFHWQSKENQVFKGSLTLIKKEERGVLYYQAINTIDLEQYLKSVISSEMNANAPLEFLKVHAIVSRSWAINRIMNVNRHYKSPDFIITSDKRIVWYDLNGHDDYDLCADDHCQRYQGISRITNRRVKQAIEETAGLVLISDNAICDARFSKCCGGAFEIFESCWANETKPYLSKGRDWKIDKGLPELSSEENAEKWILSSPESFCKDIPFYLLRRYLNLYDLSTGNPYRWKIKFTQEKLSSLIKEKTGIDFGNILDLIPMKRGTSGRITELRIVGNKTNMTIGKELEIRRILSSTHLYSSAIVIKKIFEDSSDIPSSFIIDGAGWGHGVGMCQIGAVIMAEKGYNYKEILEHYYPSSQIRKLDEMPII